MRAWIIGIAAVLAVAAVAAAWGPSWADAAQERSRLQQIVEDGSYQDLVQYRTDTGLPVMPWIEDEATFTAMQRLHAQTAQYRAAYGYGRGYGMMGRGCPMMDDDEW